MSSALTFFIDASMTSTYLALKIFLVFTVGKILLSQWALDRLSCLVAGWVMVQALQAAIILGLSSVALMYRPYFLASMFFCSVLLFLRSRLSGKSGVWTGLSLRDNPSLLFIGGVMLLMWLRSLFFFDYTWDAQTYGIPRLALWLHSGNVFLHMPTLQLNLFVNEWNAELNALAYALASGTLLGFSFGNLEVLLWLFVSIAWVARLLGVTTHWAVVLAAVIGSAPAMVGLASTVKGDLLAVVGFLMTAGWLILLRRKNSPIAFAMCLVSATLAVGSKISVALPAIAILILAVGALGWGGFRQVFRLPITTNLLFVLILGVFSSRFWINWTVYGSPLKRVDGEQAHFAIANMLANFQLAINRMFVIHDELLGHGTMWALSGSMGGAAWFIVLAILLVLTTIHRYYSFSDSLILGSRFGTEFFGTKWVMLIGSATLITTLIPMTLTPAYPWTFRYFAPGILLLLIIGAAFALHTEQTAWRRQLLIALSALTVLMNFGITMRPGEILPPLALLSEIKLADTPVNRMALYNKGPFKLASVDLLKLDTDAPLNILVFQAPDTSLIPFIGSRAQNAIKLVSKYKDLISIASKNQWDVIVISNNKLFRDENVSIDLEKSGYILVVDNSQYMIALPMPRISLTHAVEFNKLQWYPRHTDEGVHLDMVEGYPNIESSKPVDACFYTQEIEFKGSMFVRARFEGEVQGIGTHAAHLSLDGVQPIITLLPGKYTSSQSFQGVIPIQDGGQLRRLSFGLGGWSEGTGKLRLISLELFHFQLAKRGIVKTQFNHRYSL